MLEAAGSILADGKENLLSEHASLCVVCRDDMNRVCHPSEQNVNWRPPVQGQSSPVQVKDPYSGSILMLFWLALQTQRIVPCTPPKNNQKLIDESNKKTKQNRSG